MNDKTMDLMTALWFSNFRDLEVRSNENVFVIAPRFTMNAVALLLDLAKTYDRELIIYPTEVTHELGKIRCIFLNKEYSE